MQQSKSKILYIILAIVLIIGVVHFWNKYNNADSEGSSLVLEEAAPTVEGSDQIARFERLNSIQLDLTVLRDERFLALQNNEVPLPNLSLGKSDPFSAVSGSASIRIATTSVSVPLQRSSEASGR